jgi:hypothetical protein
MIHAAHSSWCVGSLPATALHGHEGGDVLLEFRDRHQPAALKVCG